MSNKHSSFENNAEANKTSPQFKYLLVVAPLVLPDQAFASLCLTPEKNVKRERLSTKLSEFKHNITIMFTITSPKP